MTQVRRDVRWDVIVVGAGPAGSTASALLAQQGFKVLVLEKDEFPRFHIGESLLPAACKVQNMLGVKPSAEIYNHKRGAQFISESTGRQNSFDFNEALPGPPRFAYQVERAKFDTVLRDRALAMGAHIRHGVRVSGVDIDEHEVRVRTDKGAEHGRYFIDASGQDRLLATQQRAVEPFREFGKAASFMHFEGLSERTLSEFQPHNDIRVMVLDDGWAWVIPLTHGRVSIGLVSRKKGLAKDAVRDYVAASPLISRWVEGAHATTPRMIGNFSYRNNKPHGPRFSCVGDSAAFIDPVFSSGVSLAMLSAVEHVELIAPALIAGTEDSPTLMKPKEAEVQRAYDTFAALVYRFYNTRFVHNFILGAPSQGELRPGVTSVLAGDVLRNDNPFADMLLNSRIVPPTRAPVASTIAEEAFEGC